MSVTAAGDGSAEAILSSLYADALPSGVCLVCTGAATGVAEFAAAQPALFHSKTAVSISQQ